VIAIDGKCLRRSHDKSSNKSAIYMVSAWSHDDVILFFENTPKSYEGTLNQEDFLRTNGHKKRDTLLVALSITMQRNLLTMYVLIGV
jgi:hypothetical protein